MKFILKNLGKHQDSKTNYIRVWIASDSLPKSSKKRAVFI